MDHKCAWCEGDIETLTKSQKGAISAGRMIYCSKKCSSAMQFRKSQTRFLRGPCPTCGEMFRTHRPEKIYCNMKCYLESEECKARLLANNAAIRLPETNCLNCNKTISNRKRIKKFCGKDCRRIYFAARFDRFIANPEQLALPQCYDEFLSQTKLPCLVDGCDWVGEHLGVHCNVTHGIPKREFKKLAGFNISTGVVPPHVRKRMSETASALVRDGVLQAPSLFEAGPREPVQRDSYASLEGKEHRQKALAIIANTDVQKPPRACRECGESVEQPYFGAILYCSIKCRSAFYARTGKKELQCTNCNKKFMGNRAQILRSDRGQNVCCSLDCRNNLNMVACLHSRGYDLKT